MDYVQDADLTWLVVLLVVLVVSPLWDKVDRWLSEMNEHAEAS